MRREEEFAGLVAGPSRVHGERAPVDHRSAVGKRAGDFESGESVGRMVAQRIEKARQHHRRDRIKREPEHRDPRPDEQRALERAAIRTGAGDPREIGGGELAQRARGRLRGELPREPGDRGVAGLRGELEGVDEARAEFGRTDLQVARDAFGGITSPPDPHGRATEHHKRGDEARAEQSQPRARTELKKRIEHARAEGRPGQPRRGAPHERARLLASPRRVGTGEPGRKIGNGRRS